MEEGGGGERTTKVCVYLSILELLGIVHVVDGDLTVGQEGVALDLPSQQQTTYNMGKRCGPL